MCMHRIYIWIHFGDSILLCWMQPIHYCFVFIWFLVEVWHWFVALWKKVVNQSNQTINKEWKSVISKSSNILSSSTRLLKSTHWNSNGKWWEWDFQQKEERKEINNWSDSKKKSDWLSHYQHQQQLRRLMVHLLENHYHTAWSSSLFVVAHSFSYFNYFLKWKWLQQQVICLNNHDITDMNACILFLVGCYPNMAICKLLSSHIINNIVIFIVADVISAIGNHFAFTNYWTSIRFTFHQIIIKNTHIFCAAL